MSKCSSIKIAFNQNTKSSLAKLFSFSLDFLEKNQLLIFASSCDLLRTDAMTKQLVILSLSTYGHIDPYLSLSSGHTLSPLSLALY